MFDTKKSARRKDSGRREVLHKRNGEGRGEVRRKDKRGVWEVYGQRK